MFITAKFDGYCKACNKHIPAGTRVGWEPNKKGVWCVGCTPPSAAKTPNQTPVSPVPPTDPRAPYKIPKRPVTGPITTGANINDPTLVEPPKAIKSWTQLASYPSKSAPGAEHHIRRGADGLSYCTCQGYNNTGKCWHVKDYITGRMSSETWSRPETRQLQDALNAGYPPPQAKTKAPPQRFGPVGCPLGVGKYANERKVGEDGVWWYQWDHNQYLWLNTHTPVHQHDARFGAPGCPQFFGSYDGQVESGTDGKTWKWFSIARVWRLYSSQSYTKGPTVTGRFSSQPQAQNIPPPGAAPVTDAKRQRINDLLNSLKSGARSAKSVTQDEINDIRDHFGQKVADAVTNAYGPEGCPDRPGTKDNEPAMGVDGKLYIWNSAYSYGSYGSPITGGKWKLSDVQPRPKKAATSSNGGGPPSWFKVLDALEEIVMAMAETGLTPEMDEAWVKYKKIKALALQPGTEAEGRLALRRAITKIVDVALN